MRSRRAPLALVLVALLACAPSAVPTPSSSAPAAGDWIGRAAATVRVSDDLEDTRDCEFVTVVSVPPGWDGKLEGMTGEETNALNEMKVATARAGGNFLLLYPGAEPSGEAYLCTE
jgi:hypothetical protein